MMKNKWLRRIIFLIALSVFVYSSVQLFLIYQKYDQLDKSYSTLEQQYAMDLSEVKEPYIKIDVEALKQRNEDSIGWIYMRDTKINYPIMFGETNDTYLHHTIDKKYNFAGTPFIDCRQDGSFTQANTIIYAHNMKNGSMFKGLEKFKQQSYVETHPYIYIFYMDGRIGKYEIYACYIADESEEEVYNPYVEDGAQYQQMGRNRSLIHTDTKLDGEAPVITLSTCVTANKPERIVVQGILIDILEVE